MNNPLVSHRKRRFHEISGIEENKVGELQNIPSVKRNSAMTILDQDLNNKNNTSSSFRISPSNKSLINNRKSSKEVKRLSQSFDKLNIEPV
jgi:hypothetical protein